MEKNRLPIGVMDKSRPRTISGSRTLAQKSSAAKPADAVRLLQSMGGNRAVQRLFESGAVQAKMSVGPANDIYEQEADRAADEVMRMPEPGARGHSAPTDRVQRKPG